MRPDHRPWTKETEAELARLWPIRSVDVIAVLLDRSYLSVKGKAQQLNLPSRRGFTTAGREEEDRRLTELWNAPDMTRDDIAKALGRSLSHINRRADTLGLPPRTNFGRCSAEQKLPKEERPRELNTQTDAESIGRALMIYASTWHLIDFKRAGYTAAEYRRHCEMSPETVAVEPCLFFNQVPRPSVADICSMTSSHAASCCEESEQSPMRQTSHGATVSRSALLYDTGTRIFR